MKYTFILLISILLLNTYKMEENLCSTISEVNKKHKTILEGKDLESLAESAEKRNINDDTLLILKNLKTPINFLIQKNTEERKKSISLLKKFTESYGKDEFKPFTYFIDCVEKDDDEIIIIFGNFGVSLDNSELEAKMKNFSLSKQLENGSTIFNVVSRLEKFNLHMRLNERTIVFKTVKDDLVPIAVLVDNIFQEKAPVVKKSSIFLSPEEKKESFSYKESMIYDGFLISTLTIGKINEEVQKNKDMVNYLKENSVSEQNELFISNLIICIKETNINFVEPNVFVKFWYGIQGIFIDNSVNRSYSLYQLVPLALNYNRNKRPDSKSIADKLLYFSKNLIVDENVETESVKIVL